MLTVVSGCQRVHLPSSRLQVQYPVEDTSHVQHYFHTPSSARDFDPQDPCSEMSVHVPVPLGGQNNRKPTTGVANSRINLVMLNLSKPLDEGNPGSTCRVHLLRAKCAAPSSDCLLVPSFLRTKLLINGGACMCAELFIAYD